MAVKPGVLKQVRNTLRSTWASLANGDSGDPIFLPSNPDQTVQVLGTFGTGGTVILEGTLEETPTTYFPLVDPQGNAISFTSAGGEVVLENVAWIRPRVTAGDGDTSLTVILLSK